MANKTSTRELKKPTMTIKERRAVKREKMTDEGRLLPRRKRADRG